jgi:hypothetical protein
MELPGEGSRRENPKEERREESRRDAREENSGQPPRNPKES